MENAYASVCGYHGRGYESALANFWTFRYERDSSQTIGEALQTINEFDFSFLEQNHVVRADVNFFSINDAVTFLKKSFMLKNQQFLC